MNNFVIISVTADGLALLGTRKSADQGRTNLGISSIEIGCVLILSVKHFLHNLIYIYHIILAPH